MALRPLTPETTAHTGLSGFDALSISELKKLGYIQYIMDWTQEDERTHKEINIFEDRTEAYAHMKSLSAKLSDLCKSEHGEPSRVDPRPALAERTVQQRSIQRASVQQQSIEMKGISTTEVDCWLRVLYDFLESFRLCLYRQDTENATTDWKIKVCEDAYRQLMKPYDELPIYKLLFVGVFMEIVERSLAYRTLGTGDYEKWTDVKIWWKGEPQSPFKGSFIGIRRFVFA